MKTSRHRSFRKIYLSLYWKGCVWEGVGDWTELQRIDSHSYGHSSISFPFSWAAQPGPGAQHLWDMVLIPASSLRLIWTPTATAQSGPEAPLCWVLVLSTASYLQLIWTSSRWGYIIICRPLFFLRALQFRTQFNLSRVKVISWYSSTGCTFYLHRCISYFDCSAGFNMQHYSLLGCILFPEEQKGLNARGKGNAQILGIIGSRHLLISGD